MTQTDNDAAPPDALPVARIRGRRRWLVYLVWLVPLVAAGVAAYLVYGHFHEYGPTITIKFQDASGLKPDQSEIRHRGVTIGEVSRLRLSEDHAHVLVSVRVRREAAGIAREGSVFWIVRPEVGLETVRGLGTVISGQYIDVLPGSGRPKTEFVGLERPSPTLGRPGLHVSLATPQLSSVRLRAAVYYRGIEVGMVSGTSLTRDGTAAHVHVLIEPRYARLVRMGSQFWNASGVDVTLSLFKGLDINVDSMRSLLFGGIVFATPSAESLQAKDGTVFLLNDKPQKEWLAWTPKIPVPGGGEAHDADAGPLLPRR